MGRGGGGRRRPGVRATGVRMHSRHDQDDDQGRDHGHRGDRCGETSRPVVDRLHGAFLAADRAGGGQRLDLGVLVEVHRLLPGANRRRYGRRGDRPPGLGQPDAGRHLERGGGERRLGLPVLVLPRVGAHLLEGVELAVVVLDRVDVVVRTPTDERVGDRRGDQDHEHDHADLHHSYSTGSRGGSGARGPPASGRVRIGAAAARRGCRRDAGSPDREPRGPVRSLPIRRPPAGRPMPGRARRCCRSSCRPGSRGGGR